MKFPNFLKIAIITNMGIFQINSSKDGSIQITDGIEFKFLEALSQALNFSYEVQVPNDREWGRNLGNGSWSGLMGILARNEADIAIGKIGIFYERSVVVDFSYAYAVERQTFATAPPGVASKEMAILSPFTKELWIAVISTAISIIFMFRVIFHRQYKYTRIIWFIFGSLLLNATGIKSKKSHERILLLAWLFGSRVLSLSFVTVILSFLTVPQKERSIDDKSRLVDVVQEGIYKCYTLRGAFQLRMLELSIDEQVVSLAKHIAENDWLITPGSKSIADILLQLNTAVIALEYSFRTLSPDSILVAPDYFNFYLLGFAVNKNFCCKNAIDKFVHRSAAAGIYAKSNEDYFFRLHLKVRRYLADGIDYSPLKFRDLVGAFIVLICGYCLSCIAFLAELIIGRWPFFQKRSFSI